MVVQELIRNMRERLEPLMGSGEAKSVIRLIFEALKGWSVTDLVVNEDREVSDFLQSEVEGIMQRVERHEPVQYVLGLARFYGMDLKVDRRVLIPRQETEEMVDMIVKEEEGRSDLRVLDVGTGSGAIAIALSRNLLFPDVTALDFSEGALEVARENADALHARIRFLHQDIFTFEPTPDSYDLIVSNPPYIPEEEKEDMEANVKDYEPAEALFVPDDNPLIFYSRIASIGAHSLSAGGRLWFEINPRFAEQLVKLLDGEKYEDIEIHKDISGRQRFVSARTASDK